MNNTDTQLAKINHARQALIEAKTTKDVKVIRDKAAAIKNYLSQQGACLEVQNHAAELKLRAERKLGEFLEGQDKNKGAATPLHYERAFIPTLADQGISEIQSYRWQKVAQVPDELFENYLLMTKEKGEDLTTAGLVRIANRQQTDQDCADTPPLPDGKFRCLVIDPPWPMAKIVRDVREQQTSDLDYPTMSLEKIEQLKIQDLAFEEGCHVFLWVTHKFLPFGFQCFDTWGIKYQCLMTWVKNVGITPFSWMYDTEHVLFGRIGSLELEQNGLRLSFEAPVTRHSEKPEIFYQRVRKVSPATRLELFQRNPHEGFEGWGNETGTVARR